MLSIYVLIRAARKYYDEKSITQNPWAKFFFSLFARFLDSTKIPHDTRNTTHVMLADDITTERIVRMGPLIVSDSIVTHRMRSNVCNNKNRKRIN